MQPKQETTEAETTIQLPPITLSVSIDVLETIAKLEQLKELVQSFKQDVMHLNERND